MKFLKYTKSSALMTVWYSLFLIAFGNLLEYPTELDMSFTDILITHYVEAYQVTILTFVSLMSAAFFVRNKAPLLAQYLSYFAFAPVLLPLLYIFTAFNVDEPGIGIFLIVSGGIAFLSGLTAYSGLLCLDFFGNDGEVGKGGES